MKGAVLAVAACAALPSAHAQSAASDVSAYLTLTSDYRNRGLSQSGGEPSLQVGGDYQHATGFFAGMWAATVEYATDPSRPSSRQHEIGYYLGYNRSLRNWSMSAGVGRYAYPRSEYDYDYNEVTGTVGYRDRIFLTASHMSDFFGRGESALNTELGFALPLAHRFELGGAVGTFDSKIIGLDYTHWNFGASKVIGRVGLDVRFYDNSLRRYGALGAARGAEWVFSASYGFSAK